VIIPLDEKIKSGNYIKVKINRATSATLFGDFMGTVDFAEEAVRLTG
jgi:hypothetical protein